MRIHLKIKKDELTKSTKLSYNYPFFKQSKKIYNKQKVLDKSFQIKKYFNEPLGDLELNNEKIKFRILLKKVMQIN